MRVRILLFVGARVIMHAWVKIREYPNAEYRCVAMA